MENFYGNIGKLGFGLMRLPKNDGVINTEEASEMVDMFMDAGYTYFDTAYVYDGSEEAARKILVDRYDREKYQLATKNAAWICRDDKEKAEKQLYTSLERTNAGYFDFYLLHSLNTGNINCFEELGMWEWALKKKEEGLIRHFGFSFHSTPEVLDELLCRHPEAEFVQLQINYADWNYPSVQSRRCYETARKHGKPVIIMEPVKGGILASPPKKVADILTAADSESSPASWAIRFAAELDGVITVLSGMSNTAQMADNIKSLKNFNGFTPEQKKTLEEVQKVINGIPMVPCTGCNYCAKVCPEGIKVSETFGAYNRELLYGDFEGAKKRATEKITERGGKTAAECIKCGKCEKICPQHIEIRKELENVAKHYNIK